MMAAEDEEKQHADKLANELALACNVLGRELSRLAGFVQWADAVVSSAEAAMGAGLPLSSGVQAARWSAQSRTADSTWGPEWFYIGDGKFAQLLADAEAVV